MRNLRNILYFAVGIFLAAAFALGTTRVHAHSVNPLLRESVASVTHKMHEKGGYCSVVMIAPERALTAAHCLWMESPSVTIRGHDYPVREGYAASPRDVAVLTIPGAPCPCAMISKTPLAIGDFVIVTGYPLGIALTVTYGEMQARIVLPEDGQEYLLVTALTTLGHSGGGVFNQYGELVGIIAAGAPGMFSLAVELLTVTLPLK